MDNDASGQSGPLSSSGLKSKVTPGPTPPPPQPSTTLPVVDVKARAGGAVEIVKRVFAEGYLMVAACAAQIPRAISFLRARRETHVAERHALLAAEALGQKLEAAEMGEQALRSQLVQVRARLQSGGSPTAATKLLAAEQRGLYVRMATPFQDAPSAPADLEPELGEARRLKALLVSSRERRAAQRLFPEERTNRFRVAGGFLIAVLGIWMGSRWLLSAGADRGAVAKGTRKEVWLDENDYYPRRRAVGVFDGDVPSGETKLYDDRERLLAVLHFQDGKEHGLCTAYYPNGAKFEEGNFVNGRPTGTQRVWFKNGKPARTSETADGEKHGEQICHYDNGNKMTVGKNVRGKLEGRMDMYAPDGKLCNILTYANGEMVKDEELIHVSPEQFKLMVERGNFQYQLKAHWK